ncbi:hypothetical protein GW17_00042354 [Ensete ventricosum]|nr:hypothetical protein GW17_00042354 [Ensete ventricosum]
MPLPPPSPALGRLPSPLTVAQPRRRRPQQAASPAAALARPRCPLLLPRDVTEGCSQPQHLLPSLLRAATQATVTVAPSSSPPHCLPPLPTASDCRCSLPFSFASRSLDRPFSLADLTCLRIQRCRFCSLQRCPAAPAILAAASSSPAAPLLPLPRRTPLLLSSTTSAPSSAPNAAELVGHLCSFFALQRPYVARVEDRFQELLHEFRRSRLESPNKTQHGESFKGSRPKKYDHAQDIGYTRMRVEFPI